MKFFILFLFFGMGGCGLVNNLPQRQVIQPQQVYVHTQTIPQGAVNTPWNCNPPKEQRGSRQLKAYCFSMQNGIEKYTWLYEDEYVYCRKRRYC